MKVDFSTMEENENQDSLYINNPGDYKLRVNKIEEKVSSNDNKYFKIEFRNERGQIHNENFFDTNRAKFRIKRLAESALQRDVHTSETEFDMYALIDRWIRCDLVYGEPYEKDGKTIKPLEIDIFSMTVTETPTDEKIDNLKEKVGEPF